MLYGGRTDDTGINRSMREQFDDMETDEESTEQRTAFGGVRAPFVQNNQRRLTSVQNRAIERDRGGARQRAEDLRARRRQVAQDDMEIAAQQAARTVLRDDGGNPSMQQQFCMWTRVGVGLGCVASGGGVDWQPTCSWPTGGR
jgi:hypothetical protein